MQTPSDQRSEKLKKVIEEDKGKSIIQMKRPQGNVLRIFQKVLATFLISLIIFVVLGVIYLAYTNTKLKRLSAINSYDTCASDYGSIIQESYPAVCITVDGRRFVQPLTMEEQKNLNSENIPANWKMYRNKDIGIEFKYPNSYILVEDDPKHIVFGVYVPPSSNNFYHLLHVYTEPQIDFSSLVPCPEYGGISPCISVGSRIDNIKMAGSEAISVQINEGDYNYFHVIQISQTSTEIRMEIHDGRSRIFNQILSTFQFLDNQDQEKETISEFLEQWDELQKDIPFEPVLGGADWFVNNFQFIANDTFIIAFEDGHVLHAALYRKQNKQFILIKSFENIPFEQNEWNKLINTYGTEGYNITTYAMNAEGKWIQVNNELLLEES